MSSLGARAILPLNARVIVDRDGKQEMRRGLALMIVRLQVVRSALSSCRPPLPAIHFSATHQIAFTSLAAFAVVTFVLLPLVRPLPYLFALGTWAPVPGLAVSFTYRYDALSHFFAFLAVSLVATGVFSINRCYLGRNTLPLAMIALLAFAHTITIVDLVALYFGWEVLGWLAWLMTRENKDSLPPSTIAHAFFGHAAGYGLLVCVVILTAAGGTTSIGGISPQASLVVLPLLMLTAAARSGLIPFQGSFDAAARLPGLFGLSVTRGLFLSTGPFLVLRTLPILAQPPSALSLLIAYCLLAALAASLMAWRAPNLRRALVAVSVADMGLIFSALLLATPAASAGAFLLLLNNTLAFAALFANRPGGQIARGSPALRLQRLLTVVAAASFLGMPPLLGFVALWQILAAFWDAQAIVPFGMAAIAIIPRSLAALRSVTTLMAPSASELVSKGTLVVARGSANVLPALLITVFSLVPWLPARYLANPAAVGGAYQSLPPSTFAASLTAGAAATLLIGASIAFACLSNRAIRSAVVDVLPWLEPRPSAMATVRWIATIAGVSAVATFSLGDHTAHIVKHQAKNSLAALAWRVESLVTVFEERYSLVTMLLVAVAITLAYAG